MSAFEPLEDRRLFSVSLLSTTLLITGTEGPDTIFIRQVDPAVIRVDDNGVVSFFSDASVNAISVDTRGGADNFQALSSDALPLTERLTINGGDGGDLLVGGHGNDLILGFGGNDIIRGGDGQDILDGGAGQNSLVGGDGGDALFAGTGSDFFDGGAGIDEVHYGTRTTGVNVSLDNVPNDGHPPSAIVEGAVITFVPGEGDNVLDTVEWVTTGFGDDTIVAGTTTVANRFRGGAGNDRIEGRAGNDTLVGGDGDDRLLGEAGNDFLIGEAGNDVLTGGTGGDAMFGGDGNDTIFADDFFPDPDIDGGAGFDSLRRDAFDPAGVSIEQVL